jgi:opine dehydrogenase
VSNKNNSKKSITWSILGGGNGGQSLSGHLALLGFPVRLYDIFEDTIESIQIRGGIEINGAVNGFGKIDLATTDIAEAIDGADIIMIVAPAVAHREIAVNCAPHLSDGQIIFMHPGSTGGALEFNKVLLDLKCNKAVTVAEANSLLYACRSQKPGVTTIFAVKKELIVAALPATETKRVVTLLNTAFPQMHASLIESENDWLYYWDGITPAIGAFVEAMDEERLAVARTFDLKMPSILEWYKMAYGADAQTLSEAVKKNMAYAEVKGQKTLYTRYLLEDIPMGLVPLVALGKLLGVEVSRMETVVKLGEFLTGRDLTSSGRSLEKLGLSGMTVKEIQAFLETGVR